MDSSSWSSKDKIDSVGKEERKLEAPRKCQILSPPHSYPPEKGFLGWGWFRGRLT